MTASYGTTLLKSLKEYRGTAMNTAIIGTTAGLEALVNVASFSCPCIEPQQLSPACKFFNNGTTTMACVNSALLNVSYGISYIFGPAVLLFVVGVASSPKLWKLWTGCCSEEKRQKKRFSARVLCEVASKGLISPIAWVLFGLLDGKYLACAITPLPYDFTTKSTYKSCIDIAEASSALTYGAQFKKNKNISQVCGWIILSAVCAVGFMMYACFECKFPLTYYHAKYYKLYRENEEAEFDDEMKIKAQKDAESNVKYFLSERREKNLWDKISTVFSFRADKKKLDYYSYLHGWIKDKKTQNSKNLSTEDGAAVPLLMLNGDANIDSSEL